MSEEAKIIKIDALTKKLTDKQSEVTQLHARKNHPKFVNSKSCDETLTEDIRLTNIEIMNISNELYVLSLSDD